MTTILRIDASARDTERVKREIEAAVAAASEAAA